MKSCSKCIHNENDSECTQGNYLTKYNYDYIGEKHVWISKYGDFQTIAQMRSDESKCGKDAKFYETKLQFFKNQLMGIFKK